MVGSEEKIEKENMNIFFSHNPLFEINQQKTLEDTMVRSISLVPPPVVDPLLMTMPLDPPVIPYPTRRPP
jgi:hypothetical protein